MATFENRKSGVRFDTDNPAPFVARPGHYLLVEQVEPDDEPDDDFEG